MTRLATPSGRRARWLIGLLATVLLATGCNPAVPTSPPTALPSSPSGPSSPPSSPSPVTSADVMKRAIPAVVKIVAYQGGAPAFTGSGTIISRDGLIVTNAHVGKPEADGLAVQYQSAFIDARVEKLVVLFTTSADQPPKARYLASVVTADGYLDAAVLRITADLDNKPVAPGSLDLPFLPVGDSDKLEHFDPLHVVGFPGIGGDTVSAAPGEVSGFVADSKVPGPRGWIKTSALIYHGNSGGLAANAAGELIGIPTRLPDFAVTGLPGGYNLIRPINLVKPLIASALAGQASTTSQYLTHGTGTEKVTQVGWTTADDKGCGVTPPVTSYLSGTKSIRGVFKWTGMTKGEDVLYALIGAHASKDRKPFLIDLIARAWDGTSDSTNSTCRVVTFSNSAGWPDDTYTLVATVDSQRRETSAMKVVVAPGGTQDGGDSIFLKGRILSSASGAAVPGATVYVLKPGVDARKWIAAKVASDVAASAVTTANGSYLMTKSVLKANQYPFVVMATGYQLWVGILGPITFPSVGDISLTPQ